jgi:hypothetical protein
MEKGQVKQMVREVQCVRAEIRKWRYRKWAGDNTGHTAK